MMFTTEARYAFDATILCSMTHRQAANTSAFIVTHRTEYVFNMHTNASPNLRIQKSRAGVLTSKLGEKANIKVSTEIRKSKLGAPRKGAEQNPESAKREESDFVKHACIASANNAARTN